jgi:Zn-dependent peptidase ImmA (M78 family)
MPAPTLIPVTPSVVVWAMAEAGVSAEGLAARAKVERATVEGWMSGALKPTKTEFAKLIDAVHRPSALFFLPTPPPPQVGSVAFRAPVGTRRHVLAPEECRDVTQARRLQEFARWVGQSEIQRPSPLPRARLDDSPAEAAARVRTWLGIEVSDQLGWGSSRVAFDTWRRALEERGVLVFLYELHQDGIRAFALPDEWAPVIGLNTAFNLEARVFSLMHEFGHLITDSRSACIGFTGPGRSGDEAERWCESFAADLLVPESALRAFLKRRPDLKLKGTQKAREAVTLLGRAFKVSQRAMALRLIHLDLAPRALYALVAHDTQVVDFPRRSGAGGGTARPQLRLQRLGPRLPTLVLDAARQGRITYKDALDYLRLGTSELPELEQLLATAVR